MTLRQCCGRNFSVASFTVFILYREDFLQFYVENVTRYVNASSSELDGASLNYAALGKCLDQVHIVRQ